MLVLPVAAERRRPLHVRLHFLALGADHLAHVRVHVGDEDVEPAVVVEVEHLDPHRAPRRPREHLAALLDEALAADVLVVLIVALHVQDVEIGPAVVVDVDRVASPDHDVSMRPVRCETSTKRLPPSLRYRMLRSARSGFRWPEKASSNPT